MGLTDKLKDLQNKAEGTVAEHRDQIKGTVQKVGDAADQHTGGRYSEKIQSAQSKAGGLVDGIGAGEAPDDAAQAAGEAAGEAGAEQA